MFKKTTKTLAFSNQLEIATELRWMIIRNHNESITLRNDLK